MAEWLVRPEGGPTALTYVVSWGAAIILAWLALRLQQRSFGWRDADQHRCGHVERGIYAELTRKKCARCGERSGWKPVQFRSRIIGRELRKPEPRA